VEDKKLEKKKKVYSHVVGDRCRHAGLEKKSEERRGESGGEFLKKRTKKLSVVI